MSKPAVIACTVNGEPIYESDVTEYIEGFRLKNVQYETDMGWAEFLRSNGFTPETMRSYVINTIFIPKMLIRQECASRGLQVTSTDLDKVIEREKEYYEQKYGGKSWESVLASFGYDPQTWRENEHDRLLEEELQEAVITDVVPTDAEIQVVANDNATEYNGMSSYYVIFPTRELAQDARNKLASPTTLEAFSALGTPVYAGWNSLPKSREAMSKEYIQASNTLGAGEVSQPVSVGDAWLLIFCDSVFNAGVGGESVLLKSVPPEIYAQLVEDATKAKSEQLFADWLNTLVVNSSIDITPMPDGLPYSVNVAVSG